jgi:hypothetical protein
MMVLPLTHSRATFARTKSQKVVVARIEKEYSDIIIVLIHPKGDPTGMASHLHYSIEAIFKEIRLIRFWKWKLWVDRI